MDLLQQLATLDRQRGTLEGYIPRLRVARWLLPATVRRFERQINARITGLTEQRSRVLADIRADPHSLRRLEELYGAQEQPASTLPRGTGGQVPSEELKILGHRVVDWELAEKEKEEQFLDGLGYYSGGLWKKEHVSDEAMDAFIDKLRTERDNTRLSRGAALDAFQRRLEREHGVGWGPVSLRREELLTEYRKTALAPSPVDVVARFRESQKPSRVKAAAVSERER